MFSFFRAFLQIVKATIFITEKILRKKIEKKYNGHRIKTENL